MSSESSDESDIEIKAAYKTSKATTKSDAPRSPMEDLLKNKEKRLTTKEMIYKALSECKTRKGISLYAIKKYMQDNFNANTEKHNYIIKKQLIIGVETGAVVRTKGAGVSGSFRLAPVGKQPKKPSRKPKKPPNDDDDDDQAIEKPKKQPTVKKSDAEPKKKDPKIKVKEGKSKAKATKDAAAILKSDKGKSKIARALKNNSPKPGTSRTPKKRANMMKRKSIGSIIKPPKMKPRAK